MSEVAEVRAAVERAESVEEVVTQEEVDAALVEAEAAVDTVLEVRDIPGVLTIAHSDDIEEWRRVRSQGSIISATAMTTVMGTNPFSSVMDLWRERMEGKRPVFSRFSLTVMNYGTLAEPELLAEANEHVEKNGPHETRPFVLTHGFVVWDEDQRFGSTPDAWRLVALTADGDSELELAELRRARSRGGRRPGASRSSPRTTWIRSSGRCSPRALAASSSSTAR